MIEVLDEVVGAREKAAQLSDVACRDQCASARVAAARSRCSSAPRTAARGALRWQAHESHQFLEQGPTDFDVAPGT